MALQKHAGHSSDTVVTAQEVNSRFLQCARSVLLGNYFNFFSHYNARAGLGRREDLGCSPGDSCQYRRYFLNW